MAPSKPTASMPAAALPAGAAVLGTVAIVSAYLFAVLRGDQKSGLTNLPDITHCVLKQPERGLFLTLFMPACVLQAGSWLVGSWSQSPKAAIFGCSACLLLVVGEAALDAKPNWTVHTIGATGFFLLSMVAQVMRASVNPRPHDTGKRAIASVNVGLVALDGVLALLKAPAWTANLIEWTLSFTVVVYHATFAADLKGARVALLLPDPAAVAPRAEAMLPEKC
mmetsp:Transcript_44562/g.147727  ORF Transcript_44562/g.147727 Transcript_44562/m.147727 type:complete len:223 (+) Transcript_44562:157-825(+)